MLMEISDCPPLLAKAQCIWGDHNFTLKWCMFIQNCLNHLLELICMNVYKFAQLVTIKANHINFNFCKNDTQKQKKFRRF